MMAPHKRGGSPVTFKYHGTLGNLIGVHLNRCPCILLSEITSSTVSLRLDSCIYFSVVIFSIWQSMAQLTLFFALLFQLQFQHFSLVLSGVWLYQYDISSGSGGACMVVHLIRKQRAPCTSPNSFAAECKALSINHWTICCFHNGVVKARSGS